MRIGRYYIYITSSCIIEGILHIHIDVTMKGSTGLAKLWVHSDGTTDVASNNGINSRDLREIQKILAINLDLIIEHWNSFKMPWGLRRNSEIHLYRG